MQNLIQKCCEAGYFIFPVQLVHAEHSAKAQPLIDNWPHKATNLIPQAIALFKDHEQASLGIVLKNNKYIVLEYNNIPGNKVEVFDFNNTPWTLGLMEFEELGKKFALRKYIAETTTTTDKIKKKANKQNLWTFLQLMEKDEGTKELFCYNEFTDDVEFNKAPPWNPLLSPGRILTDTDMVSLKVYISSKYGFEPATGIIGEAINYQAENIKKHPVREFIKGLTWDTKPRLDLWLEKGAGCENNAYVRAVGRKVLVGAVSRVFQPGCIFQYMLVLEGEQGIGKSRLVSILGGQWFTELNITEEDKDVVEYMRGRWIIEVPEMVCARKTEVDHLKAFITKTKDRVRLAYRRNATDFPRQSILIGTINPSGDNTYLRDDTGGRRFWPVMCTNIDIGWLQPNRDQLIAEAYHVYQEGTEELHLTDPEVQRIAKMHQDDRQQDDVWVVAVKKYLSKDPKNFTLENIAKEALSIEVGKIDHGIQIRIGKILKKLNVHSKRIGKEKITIYNHHEVDAMVDNVVDNVAENW